MNKGKIVFIAGLALMFVSYFLPYAHMERKTERDYRDREVVVQPEATHIFLSMAAVKDIDKCDSESDGARALLADKVMPENKLKPLDVVLSLFIPILALVLIFFAVKPEQVDKIKFGAKINYFSLLVLMLFSLCFVVLGIAGSIVPVTLALLKLPVEAESYLSVAPVLMFIGLVATLVGYYTEKGVINFSKVQVASEGPVLTIYKSFSKVVLYLLIAFSSVISALAVIFLSKSIFIGGSLGLLIGAVIADISWTIIFALPRVLEKIANKNN